MSPTHQDTWDKLPGAVKILTAVVVVFMAGLSSALVVQQFSEVPNAIQSHELRITVLEERTNRNFLYVGCKLDELVSGEPARCNLVLDAESAAILESLRRRP